MNWKEMFLAITFDQLHCTGDIVPKCKKKKPKSIQSIKDRLASLSMPPELE
jgi:hypothetical protein